ncbi:MAG TPA: phosphopyruvate hydratase, partial [Elusimicrobiales bacterium]|nr:phosphopyruvate hydratase [Elusimicrobiales bacterium]
IPTPMLNIINGGKHADSGIDVQEFMIVPINAVSFSKALKMSVEVYHNLKKILKDKRHIISVGDEGGFAPKIAKHDEVLKTIMSAIKKAGYSKKQFMLGLDCAASEFYKNGKYNFEKKHISVGELTKIYSQWIKKYPIVSIEDPLAEDDWKGWEYLTAKLGSRIKVIGDDLFVTNPKRLACGIKNKSANSILIKLNQIGTVSETVDVVNHAQKNGFSTVISHRSGETEDTFIADFAVAVNAGAIKTGAPARSERLCKYNQLLRIEEELGKKAKYAGRFAFNRTDTVKTGK